MAAGASRQRKAVDVVGDPTVSGRLLAVRQPEGHRFRGARGEPTAADTSHLDGIER
jgi:hypothetical protein